MNQEFLKASRNGQNSLQTLQLMCLHLARICGGYFACCFMYGFLFQVISEKYFVAKILLAL